MREVDAAGRRRITGDYYPYDFWTSTTARR